MMDFISRYRKLLFRVLPSGRAWNRDSTSFFYKFVEGIGVELGRIEQAITNLIEEADPRTTSQLIDEWERLVGIPDDCQEKQTTIALRRTDVVRKLTKRGGASREFFRQLALGVGYEVEIEEPALLARCGRTRCGERLYGPLWRFYFQVRTDSFDLEVARCGIARCGDRLRTFRNDTLECVVERAKPAHTKVQFIYQNGS